MSSSKNEYYSNTTDCMITVGNDNINNIDLNKITYMIHPKLKKKLVVIGKKPFNEYYKYCKDFVSLNDKTHVLQLEDDIFSFYCSNTNGGSWIFINE